MSSKITRAQAEFFKEIAAAAVNSFIELGGTKEEEAELKKQIELLLKSGMTTRDLDYALRSLARDRDEPYMKQLRYSRVILKI